MMKDPDAERFLSGIARLEDKANDGKIIPGAEQPISMSNEEADRIVKAVEQILIEEGINDAGDRLHFVAQLKEVLELCTHEGIREDAQHYLDILTRPQFNDGR